MYWEPSFLPLCPRFRYLAPDPSAQVYKYDVSLPLPRMHLCVWCFRTFLIWCGYGLTSTRRMIWVSDNYVIVVLFLQSYKEDLQNMFHPRQLTAGTWNSPVWKKKITFQTFIFLGFHVKLRAVYPPFSAAGWPCLPKTFRYELVEETREKLEAAGVEAWNGCHHDFFFATCGCCGN